MARRARDWIPGNILAAARQAGLSTPLWYVGRTNGRNHRRRKTLADLAAEGRRSTATQEGSRTRDHKRTAD